MIHMENTITKLCLDKYASLKKTGKPSKNEWTVLSGVVLENCSKELSVVSLSTGTKCLSGIELKSTKYQDCGNRLSDSHAEILARRAFLRYLYTQIEQLLTDRKSEIFYLDEECIKLKDVSFHFFTSQTPCGDCSIIPKIEYEHSMSPPKKLKIESHEGESNYGLVVNDVYRTGAKCIKNETRQDPHGKGENYHVVGPLRTKPGRGDRTLSLSCSDKMAKWNAIGVQGALLSLMIPCIKFKSITIGGGCPYSFDSMQRGIFKRFDENIKSPIISQSKLSFEQMKGNTRIRPCSSSIIWCAAKEKSIEVAVNGFRQGVTKKRNKSCSLLISRKEIFKTFLQVYEKFTRGKIFPSHPKKITYYQCKKYSLLYQNLWESKKEMFPLWPKKPSYLQECLTF